MAVNYTTKYADKIAERFKKSSITNAACGNEYSFVGAKTVKVYSVDVVPETDYNRTANGNRFGTPQNLGDTVQVDEGNHYLMSQEELENKIATLTGGRAAEELVFHSASTGASNDIEQATKLARAMITRYGMSEDFDMVALETVQNQYLGGDTSLACSAETAARIDQQVVALVKKQHEKANQILAENREKLDELAKYLYEKETITGEEFMEILNRK